MVGGQEDRVTSSDRIGQALQVTAFAVNDAIVSGEVAVHQTETLDEPWPGVPAVWRNELVGLVGNQIHVRGSPGKCRWGNGWLRPEVPEEAAGRKRGASATDVKKSAAR